jgi:hypothetical protein
MMSGLVKRNQAQPRRARHNAEAQPPADGLSRMGLRIPFRRTRRTEGRMNLEVVGTKARLRSRRANILSLACKIQIIFATHGKSLLF